MLRAVGRQWRGEDDHLQVSEGLQSEAPGCEKGFARCFLEVPLAYLGSMAAAVQPSCLWNRVRPKPCFGIIFCRIFEQNIQPKQNSDKFAL